MSPQHKVLIFLHGEVKTPPFSLAARLEAGFLLRRLQAGEKLSMPHSRPMPTIGRRCHELRINDKSKTWRIIYRIDSNAILVPEVFEKKTHLSSEVGNKTPKKVIEACQQRLNLYDTRAAGVSK